ncbi:nitrite/sulfite reductase [Deinococcus metallilatus]|uniref:Nitrite/sulfite reductase n=1 Tax=Deinococcus metallilatus TaxID=1211322 RepID=A0AAJ5JXX4_9DEIO|nr:nitrite/sulfite reductase [Deinococcus metallilatus]MBB5296539.1 sulfite reductase (ferredoxin) [Deinococcus metallilatus]QBY08433.1 nitrite/sulfite reductase [Deinococcus metallilatus]RXJ11232.1 nitrite/sulfite reductase [Deinococcus metallilatus]TLK24723.1 nitrite/sulfite reductase [Deinococcus metallilatus]GMA17457.1 ferredoxin--nitrite reductase [Deinococcus metallilatus]
MSDIEALKKEIPPFQIFDLIPQYAAQGFINPEHTDLLKWAGIYPQRPQEDGYLMMRVKVPTAEFNSDTLRVVASISEDYGRGFLDVTDRQAFQFHWLTIDKVPEIFRRLEPVGLLHTKGACGDTVRAVIASPLAGLDAREVIDVRPIAAAMEGTLSGNPDFQDLPRKFKISLTGTPELEGIHLVNDIGFLAHRVGDEVGFDVWVGGGLGAVAHLAKRLGVFVRPEEVVEVGRAIAAAYRDHGYRVSRKKSRLKFLIKDIGPERFREIVETEYLGRPLRDGPPAPVARFGGNDVLGVNPQKDGLNYVVVATTVGRIDPYKARRLAALADRYGQGVLRTTAFQNMMIPHVKSEDVAALTAELEAIDLAPKTTLRGTTIACTGTQFCRLALTETKARTANLVEHIEAKFADLDVPFTINLTGCSNACTRYQVADLGFMGSLRGGEEEVYQVHLAGSIGEAQRTGDKLKGFVPAVRLNEYVEAVLGDFRSGKLPGESFVEYADRVGHERFTPDTVLKPEREVVPA